MRSPSANGAVAKRSNAAVLRPRVSHAQQQDKSVAMQTSTAMVAKRAVIKKMATTLLLLLVLTLCCGGSRSRRTIWT